ncbi:MAG: KAP family NTPase [Actinomycetota bacterium]|nr:KAP family NTPase [Actinomycetota bacterium]
MNEQRHGARTTDTAPPDAERAGYVRADAPIEHRSEDRLKRARLAEAVADQVVHGPPGQGLVIGIVGKWGSGKTSVLKMVEEAVREWRDTVVLTFNPWLFSGAEQLVTRFLDELAAQLRHAGREGGTSNRLGRAGERLSTYAESLEPLSWLPLVGPWLGRVGGAGRVYRAVRKARNEQPSAEEQRELVRKELRELDHRILVVIDDLDRIEPVQIRDMVRLVKLVGDFPNVTYLLSYDREPVERALGETPAEGSTYLEKIVQVVHDLPDPPPEAVQQMLLEELQAVVDAIPTGPFREDDWRNILPAGIRPFFRTLRDVRRYLNAVPVTLRVVGGEVALVDVLALEALRVFVPKAHAELSGSVATLTGLERRLVGPSQGRDEADAERVKAILEAAGDQERPTREILRRLFPSVGHLVGGTRLIGSEQRARQELRVADPGVFRAYLQRALPEGTISAALVGEAVASLGDRERLARLFENLDPETAEGLIRRLEDYEHDYDPASVEPALEVLLNQLPHLPEGRRGMMGFGAELVVGRVVLRLLRRIDDESERLGLIERVLPRIEHLTGRMKLIDTAGHRENVGHKLISKEASDRLYDELRHQILSAPPSQLARERGLVDLFVRVTHEDEERGITGIREACQDDRVFLQLLRAGLGEQTSQTIGDYAVRSRPSLPWELYGQWLGEEAVRQRVEDLAAKTAGHGLPERSRAALEAAQKYASGDLSNENLRER